MTDNSLTYHDKNILVVEDHDGNLMLLRNALSKLGAQHVSVCRHAADAAELCRQQQFDFLISDVNLGNHEQNGLQLVEQLRATNALPLASVCLLISGQMQRPALMGKAELQPDDYLLKPFNHENLHQRLQKASLKRRTLLPIYQQLEAGNIKGAINACKTELSKTSRYRQFCSLVITELLWRNGDFKSAASLLNQLMNDTQLPWVVIAMARTQLYLRQFNEASELARRMLENRMVADDAHEVLAQCLLRTEKLQEACDEVKEAIRIAPHSIERHYLGCEIAQANGDYDFAKQCCLSILEQTRFSIHRSVSHLCNYVRSLLEQAANTSSEQEKRQLQNQAVDTLQREASSALVKQAKEFDFDAYRSLIAARVELLQGKMQSARQAMADANQYLARHAQFPLELAADSAYMLNELGDYEQLHALMQELDARQYTPNPVTAHALEQIRHQSEGSMQQYMLLLADAENHFIQGKFQLAYDTLKRAKRLSPGNPNLLLKLLQYAIKLQGFFTTPDADISADCRDTVQQLRRMSLDEKQSKALAILIAQAEQYLR
ncbi:response regulator [Bowmanella sp. JS7-9]|uniref:Response regulator n=1 Tax=Pseudobowmanella zhangzhouensis TaxID=1537679 RepID=A0ABW1XJ69_9ALTE|nr:response regulator [Bowmanella sp. JS7-9]TBX27480.1 hypothetical protein TK45_01720 [Bowmanella sp. JS7-9]